MEYLIDHRINLTLIHEASSKDARATYKALLYAGLHKHDAAAFTLFAAIGFTDYAGTPTMYKHQMRRLTLRISKPQPKKGDPHQ